jgi:putative ABC transport system substrate-binding protein
MRKAVVLIIISLILCSARIAHAEKACVVLSKRIAPYVEAFEGIQRVLGSSSIQRFNLGGKRERGAEVVKKIKASDCSVVIPIGTLALDVVRLQIQDRPIVYTMVSSPSSTVLAAKNIAGISIEPPPQILLETLRRVLPNANKMGVIYNPTNTLGYVNRVSSAAQSKGITLHERKVMSVKEAVRSVGELLPQVDALLLVPDPTTANRTVFEYMLLEGFRKGVPLIGLSRTHVRDGVLFTLVIDYRDTGVKTGRLVKRIWKGDLPRSLKREPPGETSLVINVKAARKIGLHIDKKILNEATEVFK